MKNMPSQLRLLLQEMEEWGRENDSLQTDRTRKMLNLEPDTAQLLSILVQSGKRTRLLEVGTSNGYSTLWLAWAAAGVGGHLTSLEMNVYKHALATTNLGRAGLSDSVTLQLGDASELIQQLPGPFDFVFLDADRTLYPTQFEPLLPRLSPDALVLADNVHSHPDEIAGYLELIDTHPEFEHVIVGVGKGLSVALRKGG